MSSIQAAQRGKLHYLDNSELGFKFSRVSGGRNIGRRYLQIASNVFLTIIMKVGPSASVREKDELSGQECDLETEVL